MNLKTIFTINCIIAFMFGAGFIFLPTLSCNLMGFNVGGDSTLIAQGMGVFVLGTAVLTFLARGTPKSEARRAIALSMVILYILLILYKLSLNLFYDLPFNLIFAAIYLIHIGLILAYAKALSMETGN
jgi:hypothetical protein